MDDNKVQAIAAAMVAVCFLGLVAGMVRSCDNDARIKIECVKAGKDPLACDKLGSRR